MSSSDSTISEKTSEEKTLTVIFEGFLKLKKLIRSQKSWFVLTQEDLTWYDSKEKKEIRGSLNLQDVYVLKSRSKKSFVLTAPDLKMKLIAMSTSLLKKWVENILNVIGKVNPERSNTIIAVGLSRKEGGRKRTWKIRIMILYPDRIAWYENRFDNLPLGSVDLRGCSVTREYSTLIEDEIVRIHTPIGRHLLFLPFSFHKRLSEVEDHRLSIDDESIPKARKSWEKALKNVISLMTGALAKEAFISFQNSENENFKDGQIYLDNGYLFFGAVDTYKTRVPISINGVELSLESETIIKLNHKTRNNISLKFDTKKKAIEWAKLIGHSYEKLYKRIQKSKPMEGLLHIKKKKKFIEKYFIFRKENFIELKEKEQEVPDSIIPLNGSIISPNHRNNGFQIFNGKLKFEFLSKPENYNHWIDYLENRISFSDEIELEEFKLNFHFTKRKQLSEEDIKELQKISKFSEQELQAMFIDFITNYKKGYIDRNLFKSFAAKIGIKNSHKRQLLYSSMDSNSNGVLSFDEIVQGIWILTKGNKEQKIQMAFAAFDRDGDGKITIDEFWWVICHLDTKLNFKQSPSIDAKKYFKKIDTDESGYITFKEFQDYSNIDKNLINMLGFIKI